MRRKVLPIGRGSLAVTIPKRWASLVGLKIGDEVEVVELPEFLLIRPAKVREPGGVARIRCNGDPNFLFRALLTSYLDGYEEIVLESSRGFTLEERKALLSVLKKVMGLEIIEESVNRVVVKNFSDTSDLSVGKAVRREYCMVASMHNDLNRALEREDSDLLVQVSERDEAVDRLYFLVVRHLRVMLANPALAAEAGLTPVDCLDYRLFSCYVEKIGDSVRNIANTLVYMGDFKPVVKGGLLEVSKGIYRLHDMASKAFFGKDKVLACKTASLARSLELKLRGLMEKGLSGWVYGVFYEVKRMLECTCDIADLVSIR